MPELTAYADGLYEAQAADNIELRGKLLLEETPEQSDGRTRGKVALIKAGTHTRNGNLYTQESLTWLQEDVRRLLESKSSKQILNMFATHRPATSEHMNPIREQCGRITGVDVQADLAFITFETLETQAGKDIASLLRDGLIEGVSLRAQPVESKKNNQGGLDVSRLKLHGADFTNDPAMQYADGDPTGVQLEEEKMAEDKEIQEEVQETPTPVVDDSKLKALQEQNEQQAKALAALIEEKRTSKADAYKAKAELALTEAKTYSAGMKTRILEAVKTRMLKAFQAKADGTWPSDADLDALYEAALKEERKVWDDVLIEVKTEETKKDMKESKGKLTAPSISTLDSKDRQNGLLSEETGGSTNPVDVICAKVLQVPVINKNGQSIFEEFDPWLSELVANQRQYMRRAVLPGTLMESQGFNFQNLLLEAGEQTSATTTPTASVSLPADLADAIIRISFPKTIAASIARTGVMNSTTKTIYTREYHPYGYNKFGSLAYGGSFSATGDEGAVTYPKKAYAEVTTVVDTAATLTVTYTNQNGTASQTASCVIPTTAVVGDRIEIIPTNVGDLFTDITTATASGWTSAGAVDFCCEDEPTQAGEATAYNKGRTELSSQTLTAVDLEIGASLSHSVIEDMMMAIGDGPGGYDVVADLAGLLAQDMADYIDRYMIYQIQSNASTAVTFAQSTPSSGYTQDEWNATIESKISTVTDAIQARSNFQPNWMLLNTTDRGRFATWMKDRFIPSPTNAQDPFRNARSVGTIYGNDVYVSNNVDRGRPLFGCSDEGIRYEVYVPLRMLGPQWDPSANVNALLRRQRAALKVVLATTLGKITIS